MIPNGHLQYQGQHLVTGTKKNQKSTKQNSEVIALENKNWLIHYHYSRREFGICGILIKEELKNSNGMNEFVNYIQGIILRHEGKIQESLEYFQRCHLLNPKGTANIKQVGRSLFLLGRHRLSLDAFTEAKNTAQSPEWDVYHNLGICFMSLGEIGKAHEFVRQAVQLGRQEKSFEALASIHLLQNDIKGAIDIYNTALDISPDNVDLSTSLGLLYMKIGEHQKAFERFGSALAHDPKSPKTLLAVGAMMQHHKEYDVALSKYKTASTHFIESPFLWNNVGMCFFGKKKFVAAITCLKRANFLAPFEWKILYNLGLVHLISQQYASAFHFLSSAVSLQARSSAVYLALAVTLIHLKDFKNARYAFEQAAAISPNDPVIHLNHALFLHKQGEQSSAGEKFKKFQELSQKTSDFEYDVLEIASNLRRLLKAFEIRGETAPFSRAGSKGEESVYKRSGKFAGIGGSSSSKPGCSCEGVENEFDTDEINDAGGRMSPLEKEPEIVEANIPTSTSERI